MNVQIIRQWYKQIKFQTKVLVLMNALIFIIFLALYLYIHSITSQNIQEEVGKKALAVSEAISASPSIIQAFDEDDPSANIQVYTDAIQHKIDAEFIVVGDKNEVRLAHPLKDRIGKKMVGDDNERALQDGKSYISKKEGSIGLSIRGKSPIIKDGDIVGVVSVGYLLEDIHKLVWKQNTPILFLLIVFLGIGMAGAFLIAQHLKKLLHKMEPEEIASLLLQKEAILQSVKEGIIAVDIHNRITLINEATKEMLQIETDVIGKRLDAILSFPLLHYAKTNEMSQDTEYIIKNEPVLMNVLSLKMDDTLYGAVLTFRKKTDLEKATRELSSIKQYSEGLRAQTHEFSNKIHTLYGLIQLQHYEEAKQFIEEELDTSSTYYPSLENQIKDAVIHGLLIAKYNIANEKGITFEIEKDSSLQKINDEQIRQCILLTLGNLIDNAFAATLSSNRPYVQLHITDVGNNIVLEVDDNGKGVPEAMIDQIFEDGITTKQTIGHGKGLFIVQRAVHALGGEILIDESDFGGARFIVILPKKGANK